MAKDKKISLIKEATLEYLGEQEFIAGEHLDDFTSMLAQDGLTGISEEQLGQALTELAQERKIAIVATCGMLQLELTAAYAGF